MRSMRVGSICIFFAAVHCGGTQAPPTSDPAAVAPSDTTSPPPPPPPGATGADAGVDASPPRTACQPTDPRATPVVVSVLPDEGERPYVDLLSSAQTSIKVFGYEMGYGGILDTLLAKARAGVAVQVILDGNTQRTVNDKYRVMLEGAGAKFEWSDPKFSYMHAKTLVVDAKDAIISTGNYSLSYMQRERNYLARITDPQDVADLGALFDADWTQTSPDLACTRLVVSPVNSEDRLVALVKSATKSLLIESMQFRGQRGDKGVVEGVVHIGTIHANRRDAFLDFSLQHRLIHPGKSISPRRNGKTR